MINFGKDQWIDYGWYGGGYWERNRFTAGFAGISGYTQLTKRIGLSGEVNMGLNEGEALGFGILGVRLGNKRKTTAVDFGVSAPIISGIYTPYLFFPYIGAVFRL